MRFDTAIDAYIVDMRHAGRINSPKTEKSYRDILVAHQADIGNRDPRTVGREDCKRTLARWPNPNSQRTRRAVLASFYDWAMEEGIRKDNPARQTRRPRQRPTNVYRLTASECLAMLDAPTSTLERRAVHLLLCAGLRNAEARHLRGRDLERDGFVHVPADIAKGGRERYVPVIGELTDVVAEIRSHVAPDEFVLCGQETLDPPFNTKLRQLPDEAMGHTTLYKVIVRVGKRAGIRERVYPHLLRHAFANHIARTTELRVAQALLGHADIGTTRGYVDAPHLDDLALAVSRVRYDTGLPLLPPAKPRRIRAMETAGIEPAVEPFRLSTDVFFAPLAETAAIYADHFTEAT